MLPRQCLKDERHLGLATWIYGGKLTLLGLPCSVTTEGTERDVIKSVIKQLIMKEKGEEIWKHYHLNFLTIQSKQEFSSNLIYLFQILNLYTLVVLLFYQESQERSCRRTWIQLPRKYHKKQEAQFWQPVSANQEVSRLCLSAGFLCLYVQYKAWKQQGCV